MPEIPSSPPALRRGLSVVIPVYNSAGSLPLLVPRLEPMLRASAPEFEVILVNDGSRDGSWDEILKLVKAHPFVRGIDLSRNYGQHNALLCGLRAASFDVTVTMDDDLQHPPEEVPKLLELLKPDVDVVYGRPEAEQHGLFRDLASQITKITLQAAMGVESARSVSAFRVFRTRLREAFRDYDSPFVSIDVLLTWGTARFTHRAVRHDPRTIGTSNYTFRKLFSHAMNMATGFSSLPLQVASGAGFLFMGVGFLLMVYVLAGLVFFGRVVPGFAFLAVTVLVFSGVQLFALGMIGEYIARMHFRIMGKPAYLKREET